MDDCKLAWIEFILIDVGSQKIPRVCLIFLCQPGMKLKAHLNLKTDVQGDSSIAGVQQLSNEVAGSGCFGEGKSPYFREIWVGKIVLHLARCVLQRWKDNLFFRFWVGFAGNCNFTLLRDSRV